jgi:hypothetical protein
MSTKGTPGERSGDRQVMENNTRDLVESGVPSDKARQLARESMQRVDQKLRRKGQR